MSASSLPAAASGWRWLPLTVAVIALDQASKAWMLHHFFLFERVHLLPVLDIILTYNTGAAFSLFADSPAHWRNALLIGFSTVAIVIVAALLWKQLRALTVTGIALSLILGGAAGNLWDRVASGRVVDFLLFYIKRYQWPVFNLADSSIVIGAGLLVIEILFHRSPADETPGA